MARESAMEEEASYLMQSGLDTVNYKVCCDCTLVYFLVTNALDLRF